MTKLKNSKSCSCGLFCRCDFKEGNDPIMKTLESVKRAKEKNKYKKYPAPAKIIDFNFKFGGKVEKMKPEPKPPQSGKIKMKSYGTEGKYTRV